MTILFIAFGSAIIYLEIVRAALGRPPQSPEGPAMMSLRPVFFALATLIVAVASLPLVSMAAQIIV